jgi:hypothetical protein
MRAIAQSADTTKNIAKNVSQEIRDIPALASSRPQPIPWFEALEKHQQRSPLRLEQGSQINRRTNLLDSNLHPLILTDMTILTVRGQ